MSSFPGPGEFIQGLVTPFPAPFLVRKQILEKDAVMGPDHPIVHFPGFKQLDDWGARR